MNDHNPCSMVLLCRYCNGSMSFCHFVNLSFEVVIELPASNATKESPTLMVLSFSLSNLCIYS